MNTVQIGDKTFKYSLKRKSINSIRLKLNSRQSFEITCPHLTPQFFLNRFISQNSNWILKNSQKITEYPSLKSLKSLSILGDKYQFIITKSTKESVIINRNEHKIYLYSSRFSELHLKTLFEKEFRKISLSLIRYHLQLLASHYGFYYKRVSVRNQRTRFGSCSSHNSLNFNWQVIFFPLDKFRHLLLHELTHLEVKNHSPKFYQKLGEYDPSYKTNNRWLSSQGKKNFILKP
ncbi:MAG: M48 family metallopeptidase [Patescibacteria group bacterium]|jgi:predicted metal-dependent hydrolase